MMGEERVEGLHVLDIETTAGPTRLIGNVAIASPVCDAPVVGFENHAGRTALGAGEKPLGRALVHGTGNNGEDGSEGVLHDGVVGTYLHGPILPKNPGVTDWLIARALARRGDHASYGEEASAYLSAVAADIVFPGGLMALREEGFDDIRAVLDYAIASEKDSILFYSELARLSSDTEARKTFLEIAEQERGHMRRLCRQRAEL